MTANVMGHINPRGSCALWAAERRAAGDAEVGGREGALVLVDEEKEKNDEADDSIFMGVRSADPSHPASPWPPTGAEGEVVGGEAAGEEEEDEDKDEDEEDEEDGGGNMFLSALRSVEVSSSAI